LGTSDRGELVEEADFSQFKGVKHALILFGGLEGIEGLIEKDESTSLDPNEADKLFHKYLNTCPNQGTLTIRTEEAILISLCKICTMLNCL
jgi:methyltransferase